MQGLFYRTLGIEPIIDASIVRILAIVIKINANALWKTMQAAMSSRFFITYIILCPYSNARIILILFSGAVGDGTFKKFAIS